VAIGKQIVSLIRHCTLALYWYIERKTK